MSHVNLAKYRLEKAKEILIEAEDALKQNHFGMSVNRSYYAMFTSAKALLAMKDLDSSKHSGVISLFNQHLVKLRLFPEEFSKFLQKAKRIRENADYGDFVKIAEEDAKDQLEHARKFVAEAKRTLLKMIENAQE
ncbi:MAG: antitoxin [Chloroflexi bacterium CG07_land_8_20_14_0_80_45_17]|nr:MAG: antitoxin [Chloroflexi bacterium CG23_combo_of_CG06-09_8_20_14_all_45_10]PIU56512.1 MAG: antitoxin [Chloroflexi bacterium CG07_land_8_20_14_0_80_45_17]